MININDYVFLDIETTGLDILRHNILELSYAVGDGDIVTLHMPDYEGIFVTADPKAMEVNRYFERFAGEDYGQWYTLSSEFIGTPGVKMQMGVPVIWLALPVSASEEWDNFFDVILPGKTIVGANPGFDRAFLEVFNDEGPLKANHRLFDVQMFSAGRAFEQRVVNYSLNYAQEYTSIPSLSTLCEHFGIEPGDHTSAGDVRATREVWKKLVGIS